MQLFDILRVSEKFVEIVFCLATKLFPHYPLSISLSLISLYMNITPGKIETQKTNLYEVPADNKAICL